MKKVLIVLLCIVLLLLVAFGGWGYGAAQSAKKQVQKLEAATASTLKLQRIESKDVEISLDEWRTLADQAASVRSEVSRISDVPGGLAGKLESFYSAQAQDKYKEAQYLQLVLEWQRTLDLKTGGESKKSKGQIETILRSLNDSQGKVNQQDISLGPAYESLQLALEEAVNAFEKELNSLASKMTYDSPATQPNIADLDRTMDEMKLAITQSLNDWVTLQDEIKDGISKLATANWINPLSGLSQKEAR